MMEQMRLWVMPAPLTVIEDHDASGKDIATFGCFYEEWFSKVMAPAKMSLYLVRITRTSRYVLGVRDIAHTGVRILKAICVKGRDGIYGGKYKTEGCPVRTLGWWCSTDSYNCLKCSGRLCFQQHQGYSGKEFQINKVYSSLGVMRDLWAKRLTCRVASLRLCMMNLRL